MPGWLDSAPDPHREQTRLVDIALVGGYAIAPTWGDGHHTGYYTFTLLRDRCPCEACSLRVGAADAAGRATATTATRSTHDRRHDAVPRPVTASSNRRAWSSVSSSAAEGSAATSMAGLRSLGGGEIHEYTSLLEDTRRQALDRLVSNATLLGANADPLDALRQLRAVGHDERDRRLWDGGHRRAGRRRARRRRPRRAMAE